MGGQGGVKFVAREALRRHIHATLSLRSLFSFFCTQALKQKLGRSSSSATGTRVMKSCSCFMALPLKGTHMIR